MDHEVAVKALGLDLAQNLRSLVADMREAMYLGELADLPEIVMEDDSVKLRFLLAPTAWLEAEPIGSASQADNGWRQSHRVKLLHIHRNGTISA
jgi:hypothetical protein